MSFYDLLRMHEGAGDPNTLFAHAQKGNTPFKGVNVSEMTLGELKEFSNPKGDYGRWVKNKLGEIGHQPRIATPMGVGQIVGTTLRNTQEQLGLSDDVIFDETTQKAMINHLAKARIDPNNKQKTLNGLRAEWEGFKHVSDDELWAAAMEMNNLDAVETQFTKAGEDRKKPFTGFQFDMKQGADATRSALERKFQPPQQYDMGTPIDPSRQGIGQHPFPTGAFPLGQQVSPMQGPMPGASPMNTPGVNWAGAGPVTPEEQEVARAAADAYNKDPSQFQVVPDASGATPVGEAEEQQKQNLIDRWGEKLFPNAEDGGQKFRDALGAAGVALGQMSAGHAVNLQPYFANIANSRQAAIDSRQAMEQQALDNDFRRQQMEINQGNLDVAKARLGLDERKAMGAGASAGIPFSEATIDKYAAVPGAQAMIEAMGDGDEQVRRQAIKDFTGLIKDNVKEGADNSEGVGALMDAVVNGRVGDYAGIIADHNLSAEDAKRVIDAMEGPSQLQIAEALTAPDSEVPPETKAALRDYIRANANHITDLPNEVVDANMKNGPAYGNELAKASGTAASMDGQLYRMEQSLLNLEDEQIEESLANQWKAIGTSWIRGLSPEAAQKFEDITGMNTDEFRKLDSATKMLTLLATAPLMEGGGQISDGERAMVATAVANEGLSNEERLKYIWQLRKLNELDRAAYNYFEDNRASDYRNYTELRQDILGAYGANTSTIADAGAEEMALNTLLKKLSTPSGRESLKKGGYDSYVGQFTGMSPADYIVEYAPKMSATDYEKVWKHLPRTTDYAFYNTDDGKYYYKDKSGNTKLLTEDRFKKLDQQPLLGEYDPGYTPDNLYGRQ